MTSDDHDQLRINTLRAICVDAVQAANSGHCGSPIRMATTDYVLRQRLIRFDPDRIIRGNDDRFDALGRKTARPCSRALLVRALTRAGDERTGVPCTEKSPMAT